MVELTEKELADIQAQAELEIEEELKEEARAEALETAKATAKRKTLAKEAPRNGGAGTRMVRISLGKHTDRLVINGRTFMHGRDYPLTLDEERTIRDIAFRTHLHQAEIKGKGFLRDFYGKQSSNASV
jgi:hypothetical protein